MKVLMLSTDQSILDADSGSQKRMLEYGKLFEELHIIILTKRLTTNDQRQVKIDDKVFIYATNSCWKLFSILDAYLILKSLVVGCKSWVITTQDPFETGLVGWLLKLRYKLPLQIQVHTDVFSPYFWKESLKNKIRVLLAKFLLPKADGIRVVSERIKNSILRKLNFLKEVQLPNINILPIFVDVEKIKNEKTKINLHKKYPDYDFIILMASRLTREKNIPMAIEAMRGLTLIKTRISADKILLLIAGDGPDREALQKSIVKSQLSNVKIKPWTNDLIYYYKTADLFLLTSNYEGYGRTVVEAMAVGLPVIMTDVGLAGELLIDDLDGRVVPVGNAKALASAILELKENPAKREDFKLNSLKLLEKWPTKQEYLKKYKNFLFATTKKEISSALLSPF